MKANRKRNVNYFNYVSFIPSFFVIGKQFKNGHCNKIVIVLMKRGAGAGQANK